MMNRIKQVIRKPLSDTDLKTILGDCKIITYPDLATSNNLDEVLPKAYDFVIILLLESPQSGHWTSLITYGTQIEYVDSYSFAPDYDLTHWMSPLDRFKHATCLLQGRNHLYHNFKYQQMKQGINTCGSHVAYRCHKFQIASFNLKDYQQHVDHPIANKAVEIASSLGYGMTGAAKHKLHDRLH